MDEAGLFMLDSIREIFDILGLEFESVQFDYEQYCNTEELKRAVVVEKKCPIVGISQFLNSLKYLSKIMS